ncbi:hypothetical protein KSF73_01880 [Burkholderiaceae bacterium DAT-1]|nr:hypothetical protein [Burkholderiaceae bacterium DAT-1]
MSEQSGTPVKRCIKCGSAGELTKAGSRRFWVQCARFGKNGNCNQIGAQEDNKKDAVSRWNAIN